MEEKRKWLAILISICLVVTLIPSAVFAEGETDSEKTIMMGTSGVDDEEVIYFGNYTKSKKHDLPWRVLDADKTNMESPNETNGMFVISEYALDEMSFSSNYTYFGPRPGGPDIAEPPDGLKYEGSIVQEWCKTFIENDNNFTEQERNAVLPTTKSDTKGTFISYTGEVEWVSGDVENILDGDKAFLISAEERRDYTFRKAVDAIDDSFLGGHWWLRSVNYTLLTPIVPNDYLYFPFWLYAYTCGCCNAPLGNPHNGLGKVCVRPAMNFDTSRILFTSPALGGKESGTTGAEALLPVEEYLPGSYHAPQTWKLTVLDNSRGGFKAKLAEGSEDRFIAGGTIKIDYSGAQTGTDEYISAMIVDKEGSVLYYGNLVNTNEEGTEAGTAELKLPAELPVSTYTLKIFNEQKNGDYKTDYSSELIDIPVLKPVSGERSSLSKATVKFTASEDVTYYYTVVEKGDPAPTIDTDDEKGSCLADATEIISLTDLTTAGAKDIYIVGKDSSGNLSNVIKIEIPKYKASYIPSEPPHTHEFGEWTVVKEPTETETGLKEHSCKCGYKETEEIPMLTPSEPAEPTEPAKPEAPADTDGEKETAGSDDRNSNGLAAERGEGESSNVPKTGDTSDIPYWFALLALSFAGLTITLRKTRREKSRR